MLDAKIELQEIKEESDDRSREGRRPRVVSRRRQIAFVRVGPDANQLRLVSPVGGAHRKVSDIPLAYGTIAWSPDGHWIVAAGDLPVHAARVGGEALYLIPVQGGEPRRLTKADPGSTLRSPAFSSDGRRLAFALCSGPIATACEVRVMDLGPGYEPASASRRMATKTYHQFESVVFTWDGDSVVYSAVTSPGVQYLWRAGVSEVREPERIEVAGNGAFGPAIAPRGHRLAFGRRHGGIGIYRLSPAGSPDPVVVSSGTASVWDYHPDFSPDGSRLAFSSTRSGVNEIWVSAADGANARQLTHGPGVWQGAASWSPDGRTIAFDSRSDAGRWSVWTIDADGGAPRQVTDDSGDQNMPTWSRDGRWIYVSSTNGGTRNIWRVPAAGGASERLTEGGSGMWSHESHDGSAVLYQPRLEDSPLLAQPLAGGPTRHVAPCVGGFRGFDIGRAGIYYLGCGSPPTPVHLLDPQNDRTRVLGPGPSAAKAMVSPCPPTNKPS